MNGPLVFTPAPSGGGLEVVICKLVMRSQEYRKKKSLQHVDETLNDEA